MKETVEKKVPEDLLVEVEEHPLDCLLRQDRIPHIWCSGCGLGPATTCYVNAIKSSKKPLNKHICVSGIGCTGRVAGYVNIDTYHTTHGRPVPFATGLQIADPELEVTVFSGDGDIVAIGGNHFIHAARRNVDINVVCVNNFNYGMTGGQGGPTTPIDAKTSTTPYGCLEYPFNLPHLAGPNKLGTGIDEMRHYKDHAIIDNNANLAEIGLDMKKDAKIVCGNFVDIEKPSFLKLNEDLIKTLAEKKEAKK